MVPEACDRQVVNGTLYRAEHGTENILFTRGSFRYLRAALPYAYRAYTQTYTDLQSRFIQTKTHRPPEKYTDDLVPMNRRMNIERTNRNHSETRRPACRASANFTFLCVSMCFPNEMFIMKARFPSG